MLKILQAGIQYYVNLEFPDVQPGFKKKKKKEKVDESEIKLATFAGIQRKQGNSKKTPASLTSANCVNHSKVENS